MLLAHNGTVFAAQQVPDAASGGFRLAFTAEHVVAEVAVMPVVILAVDARDETALFQLTATGMRPMVH